MRLSEFGPIPKRRFVVELVTFVLMFLGIPAALYVASGIGS